MNKISIEKGFLENLDYLKQLVKLIKGKPVSSFDKNLTYEVIYADTYVESIIPQIEDTKLVATLGDIKTALDLVISEIPIEEITKQRKSKDYEKLVKLKYSDNSKGSYEEDVPYKTISGVPIALYLSNKLPLLFIATIFVVFGGKFWDFLLPSSSDQEVLTYINSLVKTLSSLIATTFFLVVSFGTLFDLAYLCLPFVREMLSRKNEKDKLISIYAKSAVEAYDNQLIHFKKVKSYDRIKRNFYWLNSMISHMETIDLNKDQAVLYKQLIELKSNLDEGIKHNTAEFYRQVAKIEFLHNKFMANLI